MANEYLKRTPTSSGNTKVFTISLWIKNLINGAMMCNADTSANNGFYFAISTSASEIYAGTWHSSWQWQVRASRKVRDTSNWMHVIIAVDTTHPNPEKRVIFYINGSEQTTTEPYGYPSLNYDTLVNKLKLNAIGRWGSYGGGYLASNISDYFFIDGQALTPDVFGFHKDGDGYVSVGSTYSTEFKPGQWTPHSPSKIKKDINRRGGFGVNGFYLPMNDSSNPGADLHCTPNSIITLKGEDLPQPRNGAPTTSDAYVSQLRSDPYAANLVLAIPGISGGQGSGYGDYSADIKGSGSNKTVTANGNATVASVASYYGSALSSNADGGFSFIGSDFAFGTGDFTFECWFYMSSDTSAIRTIFDTRTTDNSSAGVFIGIDASDYLYTYAWPGGSGANQIMIPAINQWHHVALERNGSVGTVYVNGVAASVVNTGSTNYTQGGGTLMRPASVFGTSYAFTGYVQDARVYKGIAKFKGGFDISKPYTPVGIESWRTTDDTCKNNFCIMNTLAAGSKYGLLDGNLTFTNSTANWTGFIGSTHGFNTGKWYWEARINVSTAYHVFGIMDNEIKHHDISDAYFYGMTYQSDGRFYGENNGGASFSTGNTTAQTVGDVVMLAVDMDAKKMWLGINGSWLSSGNPSTGANPNWNSSRGFTDGHYYTPAFLSYSSSGMTANFGQNPSFSGTTTAGTNADGNGKGLFNYTPPTGFLALCEDNLPTPAIADPGKHFKTVLYTGSSVSGSEKSRGISGLGFKPDLVWLKSRSIIQNHQLYDSVRGFSGGKGLSTDEARVEGDIGGYSDQTYGFVSAANNNGFSVASTHATGSWVNNTGVNYCAWCWKAGGAAVSNTDGTITSQMSANQTAGFSIVSYTGNATSGATIGHGLSSTPKWIIVKERGNTNNWPVYHGSTGNTKALYLDLTNDQGGNFTGAWNNTSPTSSVFSLGNSNETNRSNGNYIAYCWAEIEGFSKFGKYIGNGNGSGDGPFVYCGFKPAWLLIKKTNGSGNENWRLFDSSRCPTNQNNKHLLPSSNSAESTESGVDLLSNGFKLRDADAHQNQSSSTYIFMAFAESPFQTANAK